MDYKYIKAHVNWATSLRDIAQLFVHAFMLMLILGALSDSLDVAKLAVSYWVSLGIIVVSRLLSAPRTFVWQFSNTPNFDGK